MTNQKISVNELKQLANETGDIREVVQLINDLVNFIPDVKDAKVQENPIFFYGKTKETLVNVFHVNQGINEKLDDIASRLYDLATELENEK